MSSPGWYPDPSGQPNSFRFWDGQAWSQQTTDNPYSPPPGAWQQPQSGHAADPGATQMAPQQPVEPTPPTPEPQQWGAAEQPTPTTPDQPQQPEQTQAWGAADPQPDPAQQWGQQPDPGQQQWGQQPDPGQQWGSTAAAGAAGWQTGPDQGSGQWGGNDSTQQFAATPAAGGAGAGGGWGDQWGGQQQWSPMGDNGNGGGGSKKALWIVLAGVLVILLIVGGIFGAMALMGDDDDDSKAGDDKSSQVDEPSDEPSDDPSDEPSDDPSDDPSDEPSDQPTDGVPPAGVPTAPVANFCTSGEPSDRETYPQDGNIHGGGLTSPPIKGYEAPPGGLADVYRFADDVATVYAETQVGKWMSVHAFGALEKEDAGSDLEAAATAVMDCMANSPDFYASLKDTKSLASESIQVDGHDAWRVRWEIQVDDPEVEAGGDVGEVVVIDTGDDDDYGVYAGVVPLNDNKRIKQLDSIVKGITVD
ncbi:DUF2510 domain-containing protein [Nocardioides alcanivorans]|uniref:DUF2510 domain-containing protein n=1 Tax=Nocardioides alcanivorans TaxID=2897352 RepID=UPI001F3E4BBA|nr:DUF2510 domain-containing protein [Nocardioides alcanivorans]